MNDEVDRLRDVCAQAYQVVGALAGELDVFGTDEIERVLDNLDAASGGEPLPHESVLPFIVPAPIGERAAQRPLKPLLSVSRDEGGHGNQRHCLMYLRYSDNQVAGNTGTLDPHGSVNVDFDANGDVVGLEIIDVSDEMVDILVRFAIDCGLGLAGLFDPGVLPARE